MRASKSCRCNKGRLSLYHTALLVVLPYALRRVGYERRGLWLQQGLALLLVPAGRLVSPGLNVNGAFVDPILGRSFEPAALHVAIIAGALVVVIYPLSALVLSRTLPRAARP